MEHTLVVCEGPGRLSLHSVDEADTWRRRDVEAEGLWPCWSPDGRTIAVSSLQPGGREVRGSIELLDAEGNQLRTAHHSIPGAPPVIAPRVPHYVNWSPGGTTLSFVAPGTDGLGLHLSDPSGAYSSDRIATGAPLFSSWSDDSRFIAVHAGSELTLYNVSARTTKHVTSNAVGFRAPVFAGGRLIFAAPAAPGVQLLSLDPDDIGDSRELARFDGGVVLQSLAGPEPAVSVSVTREPDTGNFNTLWLVDPVSGTSRRVANGPFAAAIWAPTGDRAAVVVPTQTGDGRYAIQVYDREGRYAAATEAFVPSQDYRMYLGFFDQYLISHRLWSPDGAALLCCGRLPGDGTAWSFGDRQNDYVWYWHVAKDQPLHRLTAGDSAFFRPIDGP